MITDAFPSTPERPASRTERGTAYGDVTTDTDSEQAASLRRRYLIRFEEDTLREWPLWIRLIFEFLGTFILDGAAMVSIPALG
jgi:hypothetical protein